eukprot:1144378-Pelagomonas_calceolata.AAC.1
MGLDFEVLDCISRAQEVISKGRAAQDISKVGVSSIWVWDAAVLVPTAPYAEPSKENQLEWSSVGSVRLHTHRVCL